MTIFRAMWKSSPRWRKKRRTPACAWPSKTAIWAATGSSGDWNIAHTPRAWELMFDALPMENIGLQWEPCHQMVKLIDPLPQLRKWVKKIFNVHGKDATVLWDVVREHGIDGPLPFAFHRTPGFGDSNWTDIISVLRGGGFTGQHRYRRLA